MCNRKILVIGLGKEFGGVEVFIAKTCRELIKRGYCFDFLTYNDISNITKTRLECLGGRIYKVERYSANPLRFVKEITDFYQNHKEYSIIHCHASHASMIVYTFPIWFKKNIKIIFHSHNSSGNHKLFQRGMSILVNRIVDKRLACSCKASKWMYGNNKSIIIYNGVEALRFAYNEVVRSNLFYKYQIDQKIVIGHIGRFEEQKNHKFIVEIFEEALKRNRHLVLLLIGDGKLKNKIVELISEKKLQNNIIILPFQDNIQDYYSMMDIFLLPSLFEGFPIVGVEAQAAGVQCYFSDNITKEIAITDLTHFVGAKKSAAEWAEYILQTFKTLSISERKSYADTIRRSADIDNTVETIQQVYIEMEKLV